MAAAYITHLLKDKKMLSVITQHEPLKLQRRANVYVRLCASIMSQQLSTRVAAVIFQRFLDLYGGEEPTPEQILNTPVETLRSIGLSNAKTSYVHNVARFALEKGMDPSKLETMSNEEVIEYLTQIKGVGQWTVEMLLMFTLGREDVFAIDDLGIQNAMIRLYKLDRTEKKKFREDLLRISKKWKPYRTYACMHLWQWKDNTPET
jgi:DNA-3-methyladenine glycosylase II